MDLRKSLNNIRLIDIKKITIFLVAILFSMTIFAQVTPKEKRAAFLTPPYYTNWIGANFLTISTVEAEFDVTPAQIVGLTFFYDFGDCFVGMEANEQGVVIQLAIRLFGAQATGFIQNAIDYGYEIVDIGENVNIRLNNKEVFPEVYESDVKIYRKVTENGNVYLEVANSSKNINEYEIVIYRAME